MMRNMNTMRLEDNASIYGQHQRRAGIAIDKGRARQWDCEYWRRTVRSVRDGRSSQGRYIPYLPSDCISSRLRRPRVSRLITTLESRRDAITIHTRLRATTSPL